jgi:adenylate kinase family enzyme
MSYIDTWAATTLQTLQKLRESRPNIIHIVGQPGSGKSYIFNKLRELYGDRKDCAFIDLDDIFFNTYWELRQNNNQSFNTSFDPWIIHDREATKNLDIILNKYIADGKKFIVLDGIPVVVDRAKLTYKYLIIPADEKEIESNYRRCQERDFDKLVNNIDKIRDIIHTTPVNNISADIQMTCRNGIHMSSPFSQYKFGADFIGMIYDDYKQLSQSQVFDAIQKILTS